MNKKFPEALHYCSKCITTTTCSIEEYNKLLEQFKDEDLFCCFICLTKVGDEEKKLIKINKEWIFKKTLNE